MALVADVELPPVLPDAPTGGATIWIASDDPPRRAQAWPLSEPIPTGWHEVTYREAVAILAPQVVTLVFGGASLPLSIESEIAALSTAAPDPRAVAARSLSRAPREPRLPRPPRQARAPRSGRPPRAPRAPRPPRKARPPRRARAIRPIRPPRPRNYKTNEEPGVCKGPGCTCWTPAGCATADYLGVFGGFQATDCYRGPCWHYESCVNDKCAIHAACAINDILQFWARQYRAAVAYVQPVAASALLQIQAALAPVAPFALPAGELETAPALPPGAQTAGCSAGEYWTLGLTGCRCVPIGSGLAPATLAQVIGCLGQEQFDVLVAQGQQQAAF
jgi:hypothetical protein